MEEKKQFNPLRKEVVNVKFIGVPTGLVLDKNHVNYGGMNKNVAQPIQVGKYQNGMLRNPLTNDEKEFFEKELGLEENALSVYKKTSNYWHTTTVFLKKGDNYFDLSVPDQYLQYKIVLACPELVAPSMEDFRNKPDANRMFAVTTDAVTKKLQTEELDTNVKAYALYAKYQNDLNCLSLVINDIEGRVWTGDLDATRIKIKELLEKKPSEFIRSASQSNLEDQAFIFEAFKKGVLTKQNDCYYYKGQPLAYDDQQPTIQVAAKWLKDPLNQEFFVQIKKELKK